MSVYTTRKRCVELGMIELKCSEGYTLTRISGYESTSVTTSIPESSCCKSRRCAKGRIDKKSRFDRQGRGYQSCLGQISVVIAMVYGLDCT